MIFVKVVINNQKAEVVEEISSLFPQMPDRTLAGIGFFHVMMVFFSCNMRISNIVQYLQGAGDTKNQSILE